MDLPVWVNGEQLWVKGVEKKTTCEDIVKVLLGQEYGDYSLFEKWKGVERRLRGVSKIWKIWKEWGDAQGEVRLTVKQEGRESPRRPHSKGRRRRGSRAASVEALLKLILAQGETIQGQLHRLKDKEEEIRRLEEARHRERAAALGSDYLLASYFQRETETGMVAEYPSEQTPPEEDQDPDLEDKLALWEKVAKLNKKIEREEETLVKLFVALREHGENEVIKELKRLKVESDRFAEELESNRGSLLLLENTLSERKKHLRTLCSELEESEEETVRLLEILHSYASPEGSVPGSGGERNMIGLLEAIV